MARPSTSQKPTTPCSPRPWHTSGLAPCSAHERRLAHELDLQAALAHRQREVDRRRRRQLLGELLHARLEVRRDEARRDAAGGARREQRAHVLDVVEIGRHHLAPLRVGDEVDRRRRRPRAGPAPKTTSPSGPAPWRPSRRAQRSNETRAPMPAPTAAPSSFVLRRIIRFCPFRPLRRMTTYAAGLFCRLGHPLATSGVLQSAFTPTPGAKVRRSCGGAHVR